jgi:exodeoxyribonuclease V beta subunit
VKPEFSVATDPLGRGVTVIEASAGTGKTFTIAGLFLRFIVEEGLAVREILVTTYTVAATAELRARIRTALQRALEAQQTGRTDDALVALLLPRPDFRNARTARRLGAALRAFDEAAIHTIHGFCERTLRERALESRTPFDAELLTDPAAVLRELAEDYWRTHLYAAPPALAAAAARTSGPAVTPAALARLLKDTTAHPQLAIVPGGAGAAHLGAKIEEGMTRFRREWPAWREAVNAHFLPDCPWAKKSLTDHVADWLGWVEQCAADANAPVAAYAALDAFTTERLAEHTRARAITPSHPFFELCTEVAAHRGLFATAIEAAFLEWARAELPRRLAARNVHSFDDLLTRLRTALHRPDPAPLLQRIRSQFRAALIDEFQDTDPTQADIFTRLFAHGEHWLFLIGDPKQAIYGFRGADVRTYLAATSERERQFRLATNQRSTRALVAAVNAIFSRAHAPFLESGIDFDPAHAAGRAEATPLRVAGEARPPFRFWLPEGPDALGVGEAEDNLPPRVAAEIARLCAGSATLGGRRLVPRDFAVLTFTNHQARGMRAALSAAGLPSALLSDGSVFHSDEAEELRTLLAAIVEPGRHGLVRAALATGLLARTAAEIDALAANEREWETWLLRFQRWQELWRGGSFLQMLRALLRDAGIRPRLLARPDGERALTNLLHLGELLHQAANTQRLAPPALVQWLADRQRDDSTPAEEHELRLERDDDAVKIVTVHKSKGLEYNVVICPFAWTHAALRKTERPRFHDAPHGLTLDLHWPRPAASEHAAQREKLGEQARQLYVALTRARHECHFVWGRFNRQDLSAGNWILHPPAGSPADPLAALTARAESFTPAVVRSEIAQLAAAHPESIAVEPLPDRHAPAWRPPDATDAPLAARTFRGAIDRQWRISSFTSLTEHRDSEQPDHDRTAAPIETADTGTPLTDIHAFPAGRASGVCLHAIFEHLDFTQPDTIPGLVAQQLHAHGFDRTAWRDPVAACVQRTLDAPLAPGLSLAQISLAARLTELEFHFPVAHLDAAALSALLADAGVERLAFDARHGLLKGFIDLVFEHEGRFFIVDWKSNRLGSEASAYGPAALRAAMTRHHYALQYHLYTVALHRYLRLRLGEDYDYERHFGGVFYLFVRGLIEDDGEAGIFRDRPSRELIERLEASFRL